MMIVWAHSRTGDTRMLPRDDGVDLSTADTTCHAVLY